MIHTRARREWSPLLLAMDFQRPARQAFLRAVKLAAALDIPLEILHVIKIPADRLRAAPDSRYLRSLKTTVLLELGKLLRIARDGGASAQPVLLYGDPIVCILEAVKQTKAIMIVLGTEGRTGWERLRIGSTAEGVVREAPCPVLAVHGEPVGGGSRRSARVQLERLLVATDFSPCADQALQTVVTLARLMDAKVCVVHAIETRASRKDGQHRLHVLMEKLRRQDLDVDGVCIVGEPIETIVSQAIEWKADIISVGRQGRRGLSRLLLGSVAEGVLRRAGCPVLIVNQASPLSRLRRRHGRGYSSR